MKITEHFHLEEVTVTSHRNVDNSIEEDALGAAYYTAFKMEEVRALLGHRPITINSWYRSPELNKAVGGSVKSQHMKGEAVDFTCHGYGTPYEIATKLNQHRATLRFDQLIYEGTWVHISFVIPPRVPRLEALTWMLDKSYRFGILAQRRV